MERKRTGILISGRGSNMAALIAAAAEPSFPAEIALVISNDPEANGLKMAAQNGIPTRTIARKDHASREEHDAAIDEALQECGAELVCLAGYMRRLTAGFVEKWSGRMINIHPALLPAFRGLDTHRAALAAGVRIHGCTVHFVTAEVDAGPIVAQAAVPVLAEDDEARLAARVLKAEHRLYPLALSLVASGRVSLRDGKVAHHGRNAGDTGDMLISPAPPSTESDTVDLEYLARFTP
ncbi:MAG: phosphoribosylglycinamide formyltransferase [Rhizobiales bacterium 65-79]|jgi:formyltetrahydrofolate-dependent phosphoribosylglycinamide formyltransferase|nr:phosphoribosylglycinamide formyltransferase [Hyphomicrobiales bacterium]OJU06663.1 MAG: phosphoribosylglycinamide formyltransferase [Rhizobiales bacterium 65-79]